MKEIKASRGAIFLVDDEDFEYLNQFSWTLNSCNYAGRYSDGRFITMHRLIMGNPKGKQVDHIDGNRFNNQRSNLRICTQSQNCMNRKATTKGSSGFRGVHKTKYSYQARIEVSGKKMNLGHFKEPMEAAIAYNKAAVKYHGEFAVLNDI